MKGDDSALADDVATVAGTNAGSIGAGGEISGASGEGIIGVVPVEDGVELIPGGGAYLVFLPGPMEKLGLVEEGGGAGSPPAPGGEGNRNTPGCGGPSEARDELEDTVLIEGDLVAAGAALTSRPTADGTIRAGCGPKESAIEKPDVEAINGLGEAEACGPRGGGGHDITFDYAVDLTNLIQVRIAVPVVISGLSESQSQLRS